MASREVAHVQYDKWTGTVAGDDVDRNPLGKLLGIDTKVWWVIEVDASSDGGSQYLKAWAVPESMGHDDLIRAVEEDGHVNTTLVLDLVFHMDDNNDTNPVAPPLGHLSSFADFVTFGFKRLDLRMQHSLREFPNGYPTQEVASVAESE